jgi:HEAT repeat protein
VRRPGSRSRGGCCEVPARRRLGRNIIAGGGFQFDMRFGAALIALLTFPGCGSALPKQVNPEAAGHPASDALTVEAWAVLDDAIRSGGANAYAARSVIGQIGDSVGRARVERILKGGTGSMINEVVVGLSAQQCKSFFPILKTAAEDPAIEDKGLIIKAIARAGGAEAARVLAGIADTDKWPTAGYAFGYLGEMGTVAHPALIQLAARGSSPLVLQTAIWTLNSMRVSAAIPAFRSALNDPDKKVRTAAAVALANLGLPDGRKQLEAAALDPACEGRSDVIVALAMLGDAEALLQLKKMIAGPDSGLSYEAAWAIARSQNPILRDFAYQQGLMRDPRFKGMIGGTLLDPNDPRDRATLQEMTVGENPMTRLIAAKRLLEGQSPGKAEQVIIESLSSQNLGVRYQAADAAAVRPALKPALAAQVTSDNAVMQLAALGAIADLRQDFRFDEVARLFKTGPPSVSQAAARTLAVVNPAAATTLFTETMRSQKGHLRIFSAAMLLSMKAAGATQ